MSILHIRLMMTKTVKWQQKDRLSGRRIMKPNKTNNTLSTAIYTRLSRDDGAEGESNSIANQKALLTKYASNNNLNNLVYYTDDGYSGTNFNRPDFKKMIADIEMGLIGTVIVKDMSRLGREYLQVGYYTETFFPDHDIRFIAVNDGVDSAEGEDDMAPFRNVINELYAKDISKKIKSAHRVRGMAGVPLALPPYGYMKSPDTYKVWVIDPEAAEVVRRIYKMALEGKGNETIARILQEEEILTPMSYWRKKGIKRPGKDTQLNPYKWEKNTIKTILSNQEYVGDIINFKTYSKSFKNKRRIKTDPEYWKVFHNVHEPIIDRETWELVQETINKGKRRPSNKGYEESALFSNLLFCADCGSKMWFNVNHPNDKIAFYMCSNYSKRRGTCEGTHYIRADSLKLVVENELRRLGSYFINEPEIFAEILEQKCNNNSQNKKKYFEAELNKLSKRYEQILLMFEKLYEDNVCGKIEDDWFKIMSKKYSDEKAEISVSISKIKAELLIIDGELSNKDHFISAVKKFLRFDEVNAEILKALIDKIEIYHAEGSGKSRTQRIIIHYRFIGVLDIPKEFQNDNVTLEPRAGVRIEYIPTKEKTA